MPPESVKPNAKDLEVFLKFYDQYAPKLWGLILSANLPTARSKTILVNTLMKAWRHPQRQAFGENQVLTWLLSLAYEEGLPPNTPKAVFDRS